MDVRGRDLVTGLPKTLRITSSEILEALKEPVGQIVEAISSPGKDTAELAADIMDKGIMLTGGGALLDGIDRLIAQETGMPVHIADSPLDCVAVGTGRALEELEVLRRVTISSKNLA